VTRWRRSRGRFFPTRYETKRMDVDIQAYQEQMGTTVLWWFFDFDDTQFNETYDEGDRINGKRFKGPIRLPVLSAVRIPAERRPSDEGMYGIDTIDVRMSYEQARRAGLGPELDLNTTPHLNDRVGYEGRVFEIRDILVTGQYDPTQTYMIIRVNGRQLRPDEMVFDPDFAAYSG